MKILVLGATGATGSHLVNQAVARGMAVTALVRDAKKLVPRPGLTIIEGLPTQSPDLGRALAGVDAVLSALGPRAKADPICPDTATALVAAMAEAGVKRLIWLSASGVGDSREAMNAASFVFGRIIIPLLLAKPYASHARAEAIVGASALDWTVLRPLELTEKPTGKAVAVTCTPEAKVESLKIARADLAGFMLDEVERRAWLRQMPLVHG